MTIVSMVCMILATSLSLAADTPAGTPSAFLVENTRTEKGRYVDALMVYTDSGIKPLFPINISGNIQ